MDDPMERYELIKVLGRGLMGKVQLAKDKQDGHLVALKSINKSTIKNDKEVAQLWEERNILARRSESPFVVHMEAAFQTATHLVFVLEYHPGGDFAGILARQGVIPEPAAIFYTAEIVLALRELRRLGVVYRDLKPENILVDKTGHLVLTDFGLSREMAYETINNPLKTFCGTADYLAPEVITGVCSGYDHAVDLWSLGVMVYEMMIGMPPYWDEVALEMYKKIKEAGPLRFTASISSSAKDFIMKLLQKCPQDRLGYENFDAIMSHSMFDGTNWSAVESKQTKPPFVPVMSNHMDVQYFERQFTELTPMLTPAIRMDLRSFNGFTFH